MNASGIYKITNIVNTMYYIGSTINFSKRWNRHKNDLKANRHLNSYLQNAYNKYGVEAFAFQILEYCEPKKLLEREQFYLDIYNSYDREFGYNLSPTAGNTLGVKHTEEFKKKISKITTGRKHTIEAKNKIRNAHKGKIFTKEHRNKISIARTGIKLSKEHKLKLSLAGKGKIFTKEHKEKLILSNKRRKYSEETKAKMSASLKAYYNNKRKEAVL